MTVHTAGTQFAYFGSLPVNRGGHSAITGVVRCFDKSCAAMKHSVLPVLSVLAVALVLQLSQSLVALVYILFICNFQIFNSLRHQHIVNAIRIHIKSNSQQK